MFTFTRPRACAALAALLGFLFAAPARATVTFFASGTSTVGNPVAFQADLTIIGNTLTIGLFNNSPVDSAAANDVLSSFYFDILKGGTSRPTLTYQSASGLVYQVKNNAADLPYNYTPPSVTGSSAIYQLATGTIPHVASTLMATGTGDRTWQFKQAPQLSTSSMPYLGFGIGTVGNSLFGGNGFDPSIVGPAGPSQIAFSIYRDGNVQPVGNLADEFLVLNSATFTFSGVDGWTEADIRENVLFGLGTGPDSFIALPEPATYMMAGIGGLAALGWRLRRSKLCRALLRSTAMTVLLIAAVAMGLVLLGNPAKAQGAIVLIDNEFDFAKGPQGWTSQTFAYYSVDKPVTGLNAWTHVASQGVWHVTPKAVMNDDYWIGNYLTSPVIEVAQAVDVLQFNMIHRFNFPTNISTNAPITAGQLTYRIFNASNPGAPFQPFLPGSFETGTVPPPFDERTPYSTWDVPGFTAPSGLPPLIANGLTWTNTSPGNGGGDFVATRATLRNLSPGDRVEFRLINANLGRDCLGGGWDVSYVRVNGLFLPEPDGWLLASGGGALAVAWMVRRRGHDHQRASTPSVRPLTNTPPPVLVA